MQINQSEKFTFHKGSIYALSSGLTETSFLSAGSEGLVVNADLLEPEHAAVIAKVNGQIFSLLFLPEKNHLIIGTMSGAVHIADLNQKREVHCITYHEQSVFDIKRYRQQLLIASKDGSLSVWDMDNYSLQRTMQISDQSLRMIAVQEERNEIAIASSDNQIYLIDSLHWTVKSVLKGPSNSVFSIAYLPGNSKLLAGSRDAQLYIYDSGSQVLEQQIKAHLFTINHLLCIPEKLIFASASRDKTIRIWNAETFELLKVIDHERYNGHINSVNRLLWIPSQQVLISASDDRSIAVWKID